MIHLDRETWQAAQLMLDDMTNAPNALLWLEARGMWTRGDVQRASGISGSTLRAIAEGKRPSKSQMAALKFAALYRLMGLR